MGKSSLIVRTVIAVQTSAFAQQGAPSRGEQCKNIAPPF
jgi:hypothetical protein